MKRLNLIHVLVAVMILGVLFQAACHVDHDHTIIIDDTLDVSPCFRIPHGHGPELQTVFVFHARGPKKKTPEECSDTNENEDFSELGARLSDAGLFFDYHPAFEPTFKAFDAVERSFTTWEAETGDIFELALYPPGNAPPARDGLNVIGWRRFVGAGGDFLAAAFVTELDGEIVEVDVFFNLRHKWSVGPVIAPGDLTCGDQYDIQAVSTHEIGHALGLGHVESGSDATMAPSASKGELAKQTLTPGDAAGAVAVTP